MQSGRNKIAKLFGVKEFDSKDTPSAQNLSSSVFVGDRVEVKQMLTDGADPNAQDPQSGSTMLSIAALMGHTEVVALLLEHGADVNVKSRDGGTALHAAAFLGRVETVKLLLEKRRRYDAPKWYGCHGDRGCKAGLDICQRHNCYAAT